MAFPGELLGVNGATCFLCGDEMELEVLSTPAGFYLGYYCENDGPMGRETNYMPTWEAAEAELEIIKDGGKSNQVRRM